MATAISTSLLRPKRLVRQAIANLGLRPYVKRAYYPLWHRYVELTAPCVFVHIPKTAGTSIANALGMHGISHSTAAQWQAHLGAERFTRRFRFGIVRHPVDRLVSGQLWRYALIGESEKNYGRDYAEAAELTATAEQVNEQLNSDLRVLLADNERLDKLRMLPRLQIDGRIAVDYVGKFEELDAVLAEVAKHVSIRRDMPRLKSISRETKDKVVLDRDVVETIGVRLREEFDAFGYRPEATRFHIRD